MVTKRIILNNFDEAMALFGSKDEHLRSIESGCGVRIFSRQSPSSGDFVISVRGAPAKVEAAVRAIEDAGRRGRFEARTPSASAAGDAVILAHNGKAIKPRSPAQLDYVDAIDAYEKWRGPGSGSKD